MLRACWIVPAAVFVLFAAACGGGSQPSTAPQPTRAERKEEAIKRYAERVKRDREEMLAKVTAGDNARRRVEELVGRTNPHELQPTEVTRFGVRDGDKMVAPVFVVKQVIDGSNILVTFGDEIFWVEDVSLLSVAEGKAVGFDGIIEATGTKEYVNPFGQTQRVRSFRHYDVE